MSSDAPGTIVACPRCDGPNRCVPARSGHFGQRCWCEAVTVPPGLIATLAPAARGVACLCARCIASHG